MMKRALDAGVLLLFLWAACAPAPQARTLTVFAAASLTNALTEIGEEFEGMHPGVALTFNFGGSQALRTQIEEGAPADVLASANEVEMQNLISGGFVVRGAPRIFLTNRLVVVLPADNPSGLEALEDLARPGLKLVLAAEDVPAGQYTRQALEKMDGEYGRDFKAAVLANVVSNEDNIRQVVAKVQLGEADAGIVYSSDAVAAPELQTIQIPAGLNVIAEYPIAPLQAARHPDLAAAFIEYVLSPAGQAVLQRWGFAPAG